MTPEEQTRILHNALQGMVGATAISLRHESRLRVAGSFVAYYIRIQGPGRPLMDAPVRWDQLKDFNTKPGMFAAYLNKLIVKWNEQKPTEK